MLEQAQAGWEWEGSLKSSIFWISSKQAISREKRLKFRCVCRRSIIVLCPVAENPCVKAILDEPFLPPVVPVEPIELFAESLEVDAIDRDACHRDECVPISMDAAGEAPAVDMYLDYNSVRPLGSSADAVMLEREAMRVMRPMEAVAEQMPTAPVQLPPPLPDQEQEDACCPPDEPEAKPINGEPAPSVDENAVEPVLKRHRTKSPALCRPMTSTPLQPPPMPFPDVPIEKVSEPMNPEAQLQLVDPYFILSSFVFLCFCMVKSCDR